MHKSSKVDRLLFQLEKPDECFEENVISNRPADKFVFFKNQIIKQKDKTIKMFYDYKRILKSNETQMTRYIFQLFSDRNKNKSKIYQLRKNIYNIFNIVKSFNF